MSQRDDELLTLLRAELARRDTTTPREGFDMRMHLAVRDLQRPRGGNRLMAVGVALVTVAAVVVGLAVGLRAHQDHGAKPPPPAPSAKSALLVLESDITPAESDFSLADGEGHVVRTAKAQAGAVLAGLEGRAVHIQGAKQDWVLHRDGSVTAVHPAAKAELDRAAGAVVMVDDHTAVAMTGNDSGVSQLIETDVAGGTTSVLLSGRIPPNAGSPGSFVFGIMGISRDWRTVYVQVHDMVVDGRLVSDPLVEDVDLVAHRVVRTRVLPEFDASAVMSRDGRLVAWQDAHSDDRRNITYVETHVTDLDTGHTVDIPAASMGVYQPRGMIFSPDGSRLSIAGNDNEGTPEGIYAIALVSTRDGHLLDRLQSPSMFNDELVSAGWLDDDHFAYSSITTDRPGYFDTSTGIGHVIDLSGRHGAVAIGSARGALVAIID